MSTPSPSPARSVSAILARIRDLPPTEPVGAALEGWCLREGVEGVNAETLGGVAYATVLSHQAPPAAPDAVLVTLLPTKVWVESDLFGGRHVVLQHEGCEPFTYASFFYDWRYTCNSMTWDAATKLAVSLGAVEPVESRRRELPDDLSETHFPAREAQG